MVVSYNRHRSVFVVLDTHDMHGGDTHAVVAHVAVA